MHKDIEVEAISIEEAKAIALRTFPTLKFQDIAYSIEEVIAVDKKRMLIDSFTRFKIIDHLEFYKTVGT